MTISWLYHKTQTTSSLTSIKDTTDFITKLKQFQVTSEKAYLVTLDVSSLYTKIPHEDGIEACLYFLENNGHSGSLSVHDVCALIELVLQNNYFKLNDISYRQKMSTAMGSSMARAYASLFMGKFEMNFMKICSEKPTLWLRFLDDIFMVWTHSLNKLHKFIKCLNNFHPTSNLRMTFLKQKCHSWMWTFRYKAIKSQQVHM